MGNPVFNDASGARVSAIRWGSRIFLALVVLLAAALALTLRSHVSVPGLERLVPGLDARKVRPVVRTGSANSSAERAKVATGSGTIDPKPTTRTSGSTTDARKSGSTRAVGATTAPPAAEPTSAPTVRPTTGVLAGSASPTVRAGGHGTVKPRNSKAATPSKPDQPPGQTRDPKPATDLG